MKEQISKFLKQKPNSINSQDLEEMSFEDIIAYKTLKKISDHPSMKDTFDLAKLLGEVEDKQVVQVKPIDEVLKNIEQDV